MKQALPTVVAYDTAMVNHLQVQEALEQRNNNLALARTALTALLGLTADKDVEVSALMIQLFLILPWKFRRHCFLVVLI